MAKIEKTVKVKEINTFKVQLNINDSCQIQVKSGKIYFFELSDALLRFNSGVLLPEESKPAADGIKRPGLGLIAACLRYAENNPDKKLLIAAHTDTVGSNEANVKLSEIRADSVQGILLGERDRFATACFGPHLTQEQRYPDNGSGKKKGVLWDDYTDVLKWASANFGWPCAYPAQKSTLWGATKQFQESYNASDVGSVDKPIPASGTFDKKTWGAVFDCYEAKLPELLSIDVDGLKKIRAGIKFAVDKSGIHYVACGESKPVDHTGVNNYISQTNRRVELMFMDADEDPGLPCMSGACNPPPCPLEPQVNIPIPPDIPPVTPPGPTPATVTILMKLKYPTGKSLANADYIIGVNGTNTPGKTGADGSLIEKIPESVKEISLEINGWKAIVAVQEFIPPVNEVGAAKMRLCNLCFHTDTNIDDVETPEYMDALERYQVSNGLTADGTLGAPTQLKLEEQHDY